MPHRIGSPVVAALVAALTLTACDTTTGGQPLPSGPSAGTEPPRTPKPKDRDLQSVTAALRQLDACQLLDPDAARAAGAPAGTLLPTGPHSCMLTPAANYTPGDRGVQVAVGAGNPDQFIQYSGAPLTIGGAKAYESRDYSASPKRCELNFPVSFTRVTRFRYETSGDADPCRILRQFTDASVARLRNPDAISVDPARRPFAAWDGCSFLAQLLGPAARNYTYQPTGTFDPLSGCDTTRNKDQNPNSPPDRGATPTLEVEYNRPPSIGESRQVGGKVVDLRRYDNSCELAWAQADSGTGNKWFGALVLALSAADCDTAAKLAEQAMALATQPPGDLSAQPRRPLLYKPDENDVAQPGACVDFFVSNGRDDCEPYHAIPVPSGTEAIMAAATTNRNAGCAVFSDSVKALFGSTFNPVTWGEHCFFVEPTHTQKIQVNVTPNWPPGAYGDDPRLYIERQEIRLAGKPAITFWDRSKSQFDIYLSPFNDLTRNGLLHIQVEALPGRGDILLRSVKLDPAKAETAKQVITGVTQRYFTG